MLGEFTVDTLLRGRVTLLQPARGFRSSLDPVLLAAFLSPPFGRFVDIGCGTGALAFLLAAADEGSSGVGVEIQQRLASLAAAGLARNTFADRLKILHADIRIAAGLRLVAGGARTAVLDRPEEPSLPHGSFDLVATNPPYREVSAGLQSPHPERAQANHEVSLTLDEWLDTAAALVKPSGRMAVVYPAERMRDLSAGLLRRGLVPTRWRLVQPRADRPPARVLIEARPGGEAADGPEPPLVLHDPSGGYTTEMKNMLGDGASSGSRGNAGSGG